MTDIFDDIASPARAPTAPKPAGNSFRPRFGTPHRFALGRLKTGQMNKSEEAYAKHLEAEKHAGAVLWWRFEGVKLRLADNTFLTVDFAVMRADGMLEMHEVKGFMQDDANAKLKIAADMYPFRFFVVRVRAKKHGGGWTVDEVGNAA